MKKLIPLLPLFFGLVLLNACRNKTVVLLTKRWDCMQVDNIIPPGTKMLSAKDSANAEQLKTLLQSINWTFTNNMRYECAINDRITVKGRYELLENNKIMICTPESKVSSNRYIIKLLTADELVLSGNAENTNVVLHFRPH
ncbi:MAG: hypothetical protein ACKOU7_14300 [Ferruginibacter sp.]